MLAEELIPLSRESVESWFTSAEGSGWNSSENVFFSDDQQFTTENPIEENDGVELTIENGFFDLVEPVEARLRIERTPFSALLYQEDEFGLEFLCAGYWLQKNLLLIRADCLPENVPLNMDDLVGEIFPNNRLNLRILRLEDDSDYPSSDEHQLPLHLANIQDELSSLQSCNLYVLQEDYTLFEARYSTFRKFVWSTRPIAFKRARGPCADGMLCLRIRPSSPNGWDYALVCQQSLVGMLAVERTKYERVFGRLSLLELSQAKSWINQTLEELDGNLEDYELEEGDQAEVQAEVEHDYIEEEQQEVEDDDEYTIVEDELDEEEDEEDQDSGRQLQEDQVPFFSYLWQLLF
ncbi:hypothetical protein ZHAS_00006069 [Anopheles sinensis]|uniref:Uncharacterized protein n=1 Tax=Anopheles sinensis TaxID=74873 RepID=A0A084VL30_ANOSI|nr:hypothetical protein ZHAS_00006069 [Anopheles sinensis]